ncbi:hypothetical protein C8F01DRAFT_1313142 [Mycena amicta]|nr:hypothetical protein C8F01DRAFT_1313142 [Mycena amicta]
MSIISVLVSPGKLNRTLQINSPTIRALDSADLKDLDADTSWGEIRSVQVEERDDGTHHFTRERPATRHDNFKASGRELRRETTNLQAQIDELQRQRVQDFEEIRRQRVQDRIEVRILFIDLKRMQLERAELIERYESISVCLRAFNDKLFDGTCTGGLTKNNKLRLERRHISCIAQLITFDIEDFRETHQPLSVTSQAFIATVNKALLLLTPQELAFCKELEVRLQELSPGRHTQQHPRLDASTVRNTVRTLVHSSHHATLDVVINANLQRMRKDYYNEDKADRTFFATEGSLNEADILKKEIAKLEEELRALRATQSEDAHHGADP